MTLTIEVRARSGRANELYQTLQALSPVIRKEKGCLKCQISRDMEDGEIYIVKSDWDIPESFELFIKSINGSALLGAVDLLGESSRIQIGKSANWEDIETLQKMRKGSQANGRGNVFLYDNE